MNYIFRCNTLYHLMLSIFLIENKNIKGRSYIVYKDSIKNKNDFLINIFDRLNDNGYITISIFENKWDKFFKISKDKRIAKQIKSNDKLCLYNFHWNVEAIYIDSKVYFKYCDIAVFVEDGSLCYLNYLGNPLKRLLKKIAGLKLDFNKCKKIKKVYVSDLSKYKFIDSEKLEKLDLEAMFKSSTPDFKKMLCSIFFGDSNFDFKNSDGCKNAVVFTQPLSEDGFISEERKIEIYNEITDYYSSYGKIYLKIHPRDLSDYGKLNCTIIGKNYPSELLNLLNIEYDFAIGICTSAVENSSASTKINLNPNFLNDKKLHLIKL